MFYAGISVSTSGPAKWTWHQVGNILSTFLYCDVVNKYLLLFVVCCAMPGSGEMFDVDLYMRQLRSQTTRQDIN